MVLIQHTACKHCSGKSAGKWKKEKGRAHTQPEKKIHCQKYIYWPKHTLREPKQCIVLKIEVSENVFRDMSYPIISVQQSVKSTQYFRAETKTGQNQM